VFARDLGRYRFIHIAPHGVIDSEIPQLSALILGRYRSGRPVTDPYLRAGDDLLTGTFHAEAVVLSACDPALGKECAGEGLVGLRYAALARGARACMTSMRAKSTIPAIFSTPVGAPVQNLDTGTFHELARECSFICTVFSAS
jgi:CHAT domain